MCKSRGSDPQTYYFAQFLKVGIWRQDVVRYKNHFMRTDLKCMDKSHLTENVPAEDFFHWLSQDISQSVLPKKTFEFSRKTKPLHENSDCELLAFRWFSASVTFNTKLNRMKNVLLFSHQFQLVAWIIEIVLIQPVPHQQTYSLEHRGAEEAKLSISK